MTPDDAGSAREPSRIVSDLFEAINSGDKEQALLLIHPDVVWYPTTWSGSSTLLGRGQVRAWFDQFGQSLECLRIEAADTFGLGGWVVALGTVHDTRDGSSFAVRVGWTFAVEDEMIREGRSYPSWEDAREAAGAG